MAFELTQITASGRTVYVHMVGLVRLNMATGAAEATLQSWETLADMRARKPAVVTRRYRFSPDGQALRAAAEAQILALAEFAGAVVL